MTTTERPRQRTLSDAQERIDQLEAAGDPSQLKTEISNLKNQIVSKDAEIKALKAAGSSQQGVLPATNPPPASPAAVERPLSELGKKEISVLMDEANARGDKAATDRLWREYRSRK